MERRKAIALNVFAGTYSHTSADLQAFVLGMQAMEKIYQDIEFEEDLKNETTLNTLENQSVEY
jgi:hypothetical protein